jgi:integrase/recombinase XerD
LASRRPGRRGRGGVRLVRTPRTLPRVLSPAEVDALLGALRTHRDRAMVLAMLLGGLRRCEVLGLRLCDVNVGERRVHISSGKGASESCRSRRGSSQRWASISSSSDRWT